MNPTAAPAPAELVPARKLSPLANARMDLIKRVDERLRKKTARLVEHIVEAARIDDDGVPVDGTPVDPATGRPEGWTGVKYQVAKDARRPLKLQPGYLPFAVRIHETYTKADAAQPIAPELGADVKIYMQQNTYNYPVVDLTPDSEKPKK